LESLGFVRGEVVKKKATLHGTELRSVIIGALNENINLLSKGVGVQVQWWKKKKRGRHAALGREGDERQGRKRVVRRRAEGKVSVTSRRGGKVSRTKVDIVFRWREKSTTKEKVRVTG